MLKVLLRSSKFWFAVSGLVWAVALYFVPAFPKEIKLAIDALTVIVVGAIAVDEAQRLGVDDVAMRGLPMPKRGFIAQRFVALALALAGSLILLAALAR